MGIGENRRKLYTPWGAQDQPGLPSPPSIVTPPSITGPTTSTLPPPVHTYSHCSSPPPYRTYLDSPGLRDTLPFDNWVQAQPELEHLLHHMELQ